MSGELRAPGQSRPELTEVRTVHSRAKTALADVKRDQEWAREHPHYTQAEVDLMDEMIADLEVVVAQLDKWRRK